MKGLTLQIGTEDVEKIASCIKDIAGNVSVNDIVEIVLKPREEEKKPEEPDIRMTSKEVAEAFGKGHTVIFKRIAKFLCTEADSTQKRWFRLTSFIIPQGRSYPMYEISEEGCNLYYTWMESFKGYKTMADGMERFKKAIQERFHPGAKAQYQGNFLLEGKPRSEYSTYCNMFNQFITGPAVEGREITELTEKYQKFYAVMKEVQMKARDSNRLEDALYGVAIEAEMQGFIYGFRLFDALLNKELAVAN